MVHIIKLSTEASEGGGQTVTVNLIMSTNGRYFVPPPEGEHTFNDLFKEMMMRGAGRPVDELGVPVSWTPDSLCDAIYQSDPEGRGVDLRTVQRWFSDQAIGISAPNIRLLAYIFACGDKRFLSDWQIKLSNSVEVQKKYKQKIKQAVKTRETTSSNFIVPHPEHEVGIAP